MESYASFNIRSATAELVIPTFPHNFQNDNQPFRLVPGGLAESTGLLAVNDEVLEVNGIEVAGKSLDQVSVLVVTGHLEIHAIHSRNPLFTR